MNKVNLQSITIKHKYPTSIIIQHEIQLVIYIKLDDSIP